MIIVFGVLISTMSFMLLRKKNENDKISIGILGLFVGILIIFYGFYLFVGD